MFGITFSKKTADFCIEAVVFFWENSCTIAQFILSRVHPGGHPDNITPGRCDGQYFELLVRQRLRNPRISKSDVTCVGVVCVCVAPFSQEDSGILSGRNTLWVAAFMVLDEVVKKK